MGRISKDMREILESGVLADAGDGAEEAIETLVEEFEFNSAMLGGDFEKSVRTSIRHIRDVDDRYLEGQVLQEMEGMLMSVLDLFNDAMEPMFKDPEMAAKHLLSAMMSSMLLLDAIGSVKTQIMREAKR